jgi:hypothetical protein
MSQRWDSDIKQFFVKILNSIAMGLLWMIASVTAGLYFGLAYHTDKPIIYTFIFYAAMIGTLGLLIRYLYRTWK